VTDIRRQPLPRHEGPITAEYLGLVLREMLARFDARNPQNDFKDGLVASGTGVTLGTQAKPVGRTAAVPTLFQYIGDAGRAASQRFAYPVQTANKNSVQSANVILTASSGTATSSIDVVSHSVKFGFGSVAYNAGTISGLVPETTYLVYCSDPEYAGGAVTYLATTNPDNIIGDGYYYLGYITTPITSAPGVVSAASNAAAAVLTINSHGYTSGQSVSLSSFAGGTWNTINGNTYVVTVLSVNTFSIPVDSTGFGAYTPSSGTVTRVTTSNQSGGGGGAGSGGGGSAGTRWDGLSVLA
jgi:hypothetical protein